jgi:hypothetical protein
MKIRSLHGFFIFEEASIGDLSRFSSLYGLSLAPWGANSYTFEALSGAPDYSLAGLPYLSAPTTKTYEGEPWEVMRENGLVFNFNTGLVQPMASIFQAFRISSAGGYFISPGLILPGSVRADGKRVTDYAAWYQFSSGRFKYSEVSFV